MSTSIRGTRIHTDTQTHARKHVRLRTRESVRFQYMEWKWSYHAEAFFAFIVAFVEAREKAWVQQQFNLSSHVLFTSNVTISTFRLGIWGPDMLKHAAMQDEDSATLAHQAQRESVFFDAQSKLPPTADTPEDKAAYETFIQRFGTSYMSSALYGCAQICNTINLVHDASILLRVCSFDPRSNHYANVLDSIFAIEPQRTHTSTENTHVLSPDICSIRACRGITELVIAVKADFVEKLTVEETFKLV